MEPFRMSLKKKAPFNVNQNPANPTRNVLDQSEEDEKAAMAYSDQRLFAKSLVRKCPLSLMPPHDPWQEVRQFVETFDRFVLEGDLDDFKWIIRFVVKTTPKSPWRSRHFGEMLEATAILTEIAPPHESDYGDTNTKCLRLLYIAHEVGLYAKNHVDEAPIVFPAFCHSFEFYLLRVVNIATLCNRSECPAFLKKVEELLRTWKGVETAKDDFTHGLWTERTLKKMFLLAGLAERVDDSEKPPPFNFTEFVKGIDVTQLLNDDIGDIYTRVRDDPDLPWYDWPAACFIGGFANWAPNRPVDPEELKPPPRCKIPQEVHDAVEIMLARIPNYRKPMRDIIDDPGFLGFTDLWEPIMKCPKMGEPYIQTCDGIDMEIKKDLWKWAEGDYDEDAPEWVKKYRQQNPEEPIPNLGNHYDPPDSKRKARIFRERSEKAQRIAVMEAILAERKKEAVEKAAAQPRARGRISVANDRSARARGAVINNEAAAKAPEERLPLSEGGGVKESNTKVPEFGHSGWEIGSRRPQRNMLTSLAAQKAALAKEPRVPYGEEPIADESET